MCVEKQNALRKGLSEEDAAQIASFDETEDILFERTEMDYSIPAMELQKKLFAYVRQNLPEHEKRDPAAGVSYEGIAENKGMTTMCEIARKIYKKGSDEQLFKSVKALMETTKSFTMAVKMLKLSQEDIDLCKGEFNIP